MSKKVKAKGAYSTDRQWHQDQSMMVVRQAAYNHLINGTPLLETIHGNDDLFDFCLRFKANKTDYLWLKHEDGTQEELQRVTRYYVANSDHHLVVQRPPITRKFTKKLEILFKRHDYDPTGEQIEEIKAALREKREPNWDEIGNPPEEVADELKPRIRFANIQDGFNVTVANRMPDKFPDDIDYSFYEGEAKKLTDIFTKNI